MTNSWLNKLRLIFQIIAEFYSYPKVINFCDINSCGINFCDFGQNCKNYFRKNFQFLPIAKIYSAKNVILPFFYFSFQNSLRVLNCKTALDRGFSSVYITYAGRRQALACGWIYMHVL